MKNKVGAFTSTSVSLSVLVSKLNFPPHQYKISRGKNVYLSQHANNDLHHQFFVS